MKTYAQIFEATKRKSAPKFKKLPEPEKANPYWNKIKRGEEQLSNWKKDLKDLKGLQRQNKQAQIKKKEEQLKKWNKAEDEWLKNNRKKKNESLNENNNAEKAERNANRNPGQPIIRRDGSEVKGTIIISVDSARLLYIRVGSNTSIIEIGRNTEEEVYISSKEAKTLKKYL